MLNLRHNRRAQEREHYAQDRLRRALLRTLAHFLVKEFRRVGREAGQHYSADGISHAIAGHRHRMTNVFTHFYENVFSTFGKRTALRLQGQKALSTVDELDRVPDMSADVWMRAGKEYVRNWTGKRVDEISKTSERKIREAVGSALGNDSTYEQVAKHIEDSLDDPSRAMTIARTEVHSASQGASQAVAEQSGMTLTKQWIAVEDERTRQDHIDADGQEVPLTDAFKVGDESLDFPGDPEGSAGEIINCRCVAVYNSAESA